MNFSRAYRFLLREALQRGIPHGLVHWRYLQLDPPQFVQIHRQLWLQSLPPLPRSLWWLLECFLWLRWVLWGAWYRTWKCVLRWGKAVKAHEGISIARQAEQVLRLSIGYCIPPAHIYRYGLYRDPERVWAYVYEHELAVFHRWRSLPLNEKPESLALLQDKYRLSKLLQSLGIPVVPTLALILRHGAFDFSCRPPSSKLFCKRRHGSRGEGAFIVETQAVGFKLHPFDDTTVLEMDVSGYLQRNLAIDDYLIQVDLENHPKLATLTESDKAITLRVISESSGQRYYCATLAIPVQKKKLKQCCHVILPVDLKTGKIGSTPEAPLLPVANEAYRIVCGKIDGLYIPFWQDVLAHVKLAQQQFPDVYAIAWDFIVTPEGPCLLEGNSTWGAMTEQMICGGLLQ